MIDVNVYLGQWPYRRLPLDEPKALADKLRALGIERAWAASFDALLHRDVTHLNARLAQACRDSGGFFEPVAALDPTSPGWETDLDRAIYEFEAKGARLHPNYHGYKLDDPRLEESLTMAAERKLLVQLPLTMEDDRTRHPRFSPPSVDAGPLAALVAKVKGLRLMVLNTKAITVEQAADVAKAGNVWFDLAMIEGLEKVAVWAEAVGPERIVFGSYSPFFIPESAAAKLLESGLPESVLAKITKENALAALVFPK